MNEQFKELRYLVGEAWQGTYNAATVYGNANVVQDPTGLSVYRSLKPGNVGHALSDTSWWFKIIDLSSIKQEADHLQELDTEMTEHEDARVSAENQRISKEQARINAENARIQAEQTRASQETARVQAEQTRVKQEQVRVSQETTRTTQENQRMRAEEQRVTKETQRVNAEQQRVLAEQNRVSAEQSRIESEQSRVEQEQLREHRPMIDQPMLQHLCIARKQVLPIHGPEEHSVKNHRRSIAKHADLILR